MNTERVWAYKIRPAQGHTKCRVGNAFLPTFFMPLLYPAWAQKACPPYRA